MTNHRERALNICLWSQILQQMVVLDVKHTQLYSSFSIASSHQADVSTHFAARSFSRNTFIAQPKFTAFNPLNPKTHRHVFFKQSPKTTVYQGQKKNHHHRQILSFPTVLEHIMWRTLPPQKETITKLKIEIFHQKHFYSTCIFLKWSVHFNQIV